jgi:hypothetical protein
MTGDCADSVLATTKATSIAKATERILFLASSAGIDSRRVKGFGDRGELRINLHHILGDRGLLALHFLGDSEDLLGLLLACARSFGCGGSHEQGQGEKGG